MAEALIDDPERQMDDAYFALDQAIASKQLVELHTHLLGMGSADFWVDTIMRVYLKRLQQDIEKPGKSKFISHLNKQFSYLLDDDLPDVADLMAKVKSNNFADLQNVSFCQDSIELLKNQGDSYDKFHDLYTSDVVYSLEALLLVFDLPFSKNSEEIELHKLVSILESKLFYSEYRDYHIKEYIIFNARKRQFQLVEGIVNSELCKLLEDPSIHAAFKNGFSMLNRDGTDSAHQDYFRGKFGQEFYPKRFKLKDCIYQQRLEVLSILLNDVCNRYDRSGVRYVEYSLGVNDLLNKDVIWHLARAHTTPLKYVPKQADSGSEQQRSSQEVESADGYDDEPDLNNKRLHSSRVSSRKICSKVTLQQKSLNVGKPNTLGPSWRKYCTFYHEKPNSFAIRYLAAFNRGEVKYDDSSLPDPMFGHIPNVSDITNLDFEMCFPKFWNEGVMSKIYDLENIDKVYGFWQHFVVGLDWVGDEYGNPYCVFQHDSFTGPKGLVALMRTHQPKFGIRIHCGESLPTEICHSHTKSVHMRLAHKNHMTVISEQLQLIYKKLVKLGQKGPHLRIGHGLAFLHRDQSKIRKFLKNKTNQIVCEINMTSNKYLLTTTFHGTEQENSHYLALKQFLKYKLPVVLSTDDDGIWPIPMCNTHKNHQSLAAEFCEAIEQKSLTNKDQVDKLIRTALNVAFGDIHN